MEQRQAYAYVQVDGRGLKEVHEQGLHGHDLKLDFNALHFNCMREFRRQLEEDVFQFDIGATE